MTTCKCERPAPLQTQVSRHICASCSEEIAGPDPRDAEIAALKADWSSLRGENDALRDACRAQIDSGAAGRVAALYQRAIAAESDLARLKAEVDFLRARERSICAAVGGVSDGGKFRNDIIEHLTTIYADLAAHKRALAAGPALLRSCVTALPHGDERRRAFEVLASTVEEVQTLALSPRQEIAPIPVMVVAQGEDEKP